MNKILTDFDGVLLRTEFAKAAEWFIASLRIQGRISEEFIKDLEEKRQEALVKVKEICCQYREEFERITNLAGMSRKDTRDAVWKLSSYDSKDYTPEDLEKIRGRMKNPIEGYYSERIEGNIRFFQEAKKSGLELGLITQAREEEIRGLSVELGLSLNDLFKRSECTGDDFYKDMGKKNDPYASYIDKKVVGYGCLCSSLGINPWGTITFEDSESGVSAANSAGVVCIGFKDKHNKQNLSKSVLVVPRDLDVLVNDETMSILRNENPREFVLYANDYLRRMGLQPELREDYRNARTNSQKEVTINARSESRF